MILRTRASTAVVDGLTRLALSTLVATVMLGTPAAAGAATWCDPVVDPSCIDDGTYEGDPYGTTWYDDGTHEGDPYGTTWYDDGTYEGDPYGTTWYDDGTYEGDPYGTTWYDDGTYEGDPYGTTWYDDGTGDAGPPPTFSGGATAAPDVLAMLERVDSSGLVDRVDPADLPLDEAARNGAARLVLGIDALAELGAFRRDPDPAVNGTVREVRNLIPPAGLDTEGYRSEMSMLGDDLGQLVDVLEAAGTLGEPLSEVERTLTDEALLARLGEGATGLHDPDLWISAAADLLLRSGAEPLIEEQRNDDAPAVLALADHLGGSAGTAAVADDPDDAASSVTSTTEAEEPGPVDEMTATTGDAGADSGPTWPVPVALAVVLGGLGVLLVTRRRSDRNEPPAEPPTPPATDPTPAGLASLEDLLDVSRRMTSSLDRAEVAEIALAEAERLVGAEGGLLMVRTDDGLETLSHRPPALFDLEALDRGAIRRVLDTGRSIVQVTDDEPCLVEVPMALAAIPVVAEGTVAGAILVVRVSAQPFARQDLDGLEMLAPLIGSALRSAEAHGSAAMLADIDPLSGLNNRRRLTSDLAMGAERPLATIMIDIDHFKHFNDTNGHAAGDEALRRVAGLLAANVRSGDIVYRYGGEEFCVLLPDTGIDQALEVAERVRAAVEAADIPGGENQPGGRVTISVGVARCEPGGHPEVMEAADAALYRAKDGGRNRVCIGAD